MRQGIASNTKGTAFVVYEDVMDAKTACDKLNGYNFQNRYLVGKCYMLFRCVLHHVAALCPDSRLTYICFLPPCSSIPPAREDGQVKRGPRRPQGEFSSAQEAARYRLTIRRACWRLADSTSHPTVCRPVFLIANPAHTFFCNPAGECRP